MYTETEYCRFCIVCLSSYAAHFFLVVLLFARRTYLARAGIFLRPAQRRLTSSCTIHTTQQSFRYNRDVSNMEVDHQGNSLAARRNAKPDGEQASPIAAKESISVAAIFKKRKT